MTEKKQNLKVIIILSAVCCLLIAGLQLYLKSWKKMDLIIFMGQSNMSGANGNAEEAPELVEGAGYEYRAITDPDQLHVLEEPFGENEHREGAIDDRDLLERRGTLVTAFVNAYYEKTNTPVVAVSASRGSSSISSWLEKGLLEDAKERLEAAKEYMKKHRIAVGHTYMVWYQGETDANKKTPASEYKEGMQELVDSMQEAGVEKCLMIQIGNDLLDLQHYDVIIETQQELCDEAEDFVMISTLPAQLVGKDAMDEGGVHFTQEFLNKIGTDAGTNAGIYASEH